MRLTAIGSTIDGDSGLFAHVRRRSLSLITRDSGCTDYGERVANVWGSRGRSVVRL
jgi:hypothetical protein